MSRLAPSPTGALHLGNVRTFLVNWALARTGGWDLLLRIEDLDGPRVKSQATEETLRTLEWLAIDHDGRILRQSDDLEPYRGAMRRLAEARRAYSCRLSRREIEAAAAAPHRDGQETSCPAALRPAEPDRYRFDREDTNYRLAVEPQAIEIVDELAGRTVHRPHEEVGDFVIWTKRGTPAYQLAVVVDDARQAVTDVVRGDDLLPSAARQCLLYSALDLRPPRWWHLPLVVGPDGRRLAKRHGDTRIDRYRRAGVRAERIIGLMGYWCGLTAAPREMSTEEFRTAFDQERLGREPIVFTEKDEAWLCGSD